MNTDATPRGFVNLSASDRELCDAIRALQDKAAALAPEDAAIFAINDELNRLRQDLIFNKRNRASQPK